MVKNYLVKGYTIQDLLELKKQKEAELEEIKKRLRKLVNEGR